FRADADRLVDRRDEDFAIADLARLGGLHNGTDGGLHAGIRQDEFDFDLGQEIDGILAAAIDLRMALLAAKAFDFSDGHAFDTNVSEGILDLFEFEGFDDGFNFLHAMLRRYGFWVMCGCMSLRAPAQEQRECQSLQSRAVAAEPL